VRANQLGAGRAERESPGRVVQQRERRAREILRAVRHQRVHSGLEAIEALARD